MSIRDAVHAFEPESPGSMYCRCALMERHPRHNVETPPVLPYAGTSGWDGSDTSRERAEREDTDGTTSARQAKVLDLLTSAVNGYTWRELAEVTGWHHGQASGALSGLHKEGRIARLALRRDRCQVYVALDHVDGRETVPHGRERLSSEERAALDRAEAAIEADSRPGYGDVIMVVRALRRLT